MRRLILIGAMLGMMLAGSVAAAAVQARQEVTTPQWEFQIVVIGKLETLAANSVTVSNRVSAQGWEPMQMTISPDGVYAVLFRRPKP